MARYTFDEVVLRGSKYGICPVCNKRAARSEKFWQTLNPYNKNDAGRLKSRYEICAELVKERRVWMTEPVMHAKCEGKGVAS